MYMIYINPAFPGGDLAHKSQHSEEILQPGLTQTNPEKILIIYFLPLRRTAMFQYDR